VKKALAVLLLIFASSAGVAQESTRGVGPLPVEQPYRDPHKARVLATILPGAGYVYTGEYLRGYGTWVITASMFIYAPFLYEYGSCGSASIDKCMHGFLRWESRAMGALAAGVGLWNWIESVRDAPLSAERANERRRRRELRVVPTVDLSPRDPKQLRAGVNVGW